MAQVKYYLAEGINRNNTPVKCIIAVWEQFCGPDEDCTESYAKQKLWHTQDMNRIDFMEEVTPSINDINHWAVSHYLQELKERFEFGVAMVVLYDYTDEPPPEDADDEDDEDNEYGDWHSEEEREDEEKKKKQEAR